MLFAAGCLQTVLGWIRNDGTRPLPVDEAVGNGEQQYMFCLGVYVSMEECSNMLHLHTVTLHTARMTICNMFIDNIVICTSYKVAFIIFKYMYRGVNYILIYFILIYRWSTLLDLVQLTIYTGCFRNTDTNFTRMWRTAKKVLFANYKTLKTPSFQEIPQSSIRAAANN